MISRLEENWIDTKESFSMLTEELLKELKIPLMLIKKIVDKNQQQSQNAPTQNQKP